MMTSDDRDMTTAKSNLYGIQYCVRFYWGVGRELRLRSVRIYFIPTVLSTVDCRINRDHYQPKTTALTPFQPPSIIMTPPVPQPPGAFELSRYRSSPPDMFSARRRFHDDAAAQTLIYDAWEAQGVQEKFRLCERALARFPFSVDAYNCIGDLYRRFWKDLDKAQIAYEHALTCALLLWPGIDHEAEIPWGMVDNRPFLRSYHGLGVSLLDKGDAQGANEKFRFLLRVNPGDNQGCRLLVFQTLIELGEYSEAEKIAEKHSNGRESNECYFRYGFVLMDYLRHKLGACSEQQLECTLVQALQNNNFVPQFLLQNETLPPRPDTVSPGGRDEALGYANASLDTWKRIAGSLSWLDKMRSRDGPKPNDDGSVLFELLQKGKVVVVVANELGGEGTRTIEVTTRFSDMSGQKLQHFKLPVGMKEHDPAKIVCFATRNDSGTLGTLFTLFRYSKVQKVYFWSVLKSSEVYGATGGEFCSVCYEPASLKCSKCQVTWYCSRECQRKDWREGRPLPHKQACDNYTKK
jgi:tetratricopeptide (TPR) repeat protein